MAQIKPFNGLRFSKEAGDIGSLTCPPYDIICDSERERLIEKNPYNIVRLELPVGENCYEKAAEELQLWLSQKILLQDSEPFYYAYEQKFLHYGRDYTLKGLIARVRLEEFEKGIILPHEDTLSKAKEDRFQLMKATGCNFSQIYSLYNDPTNKAASIIDKLTLRVPDSEMKDSGQVRHRLWLIPQAAKIRKLERILEYKKLYIADGHHRYETAVRYRNYLRETGVNTNDDHPSNFIMMMLTDMNNPGLVVLPTHRMVHSLEKFNFDALIKKSVAYFDVESFSDKSAAQRKMEMNCMKHTAFMIYKDKKYILFTFKDSSIMDKVFPNASDAYKNLDVAIIHALLLEDLLNIDKEKLANQENIAYTRSEEEAIQKTDSGEADFCIILAPTKVSEIKDVALAGEKMPQKSTYFYPKLITGLVMNKII